MILGSGEKTSNSALSSDNNFRNLKGGVKDLKKTTAFDFRQGKTKIFMN